MKELIYKKFLKKCLSVLNKLIVNDNGHILILLFLSNKGYDLWLEYNVFIFYLIIIMKKNFKFHILFL